MNDVNQNISSGASKRPLSVKAAAFAVCVLALAGAGVALAAVGLGEQVPEEPQPAVVPETLGATVKADGVFVAGPVAQRGDVLENVAPATELTGSYADAYYRASLNGRTVYVEKRFVRTAEEAAPEEWTGYAAADAIIYARPDFSGDDILTLQLNEEVTVLDAFNDLLFVRNADGFEGYLPASMILREKAPEAVVPAAAASSSSSPSRGNGSSSGGSSHSGSSSSGGSSSSSGSSGGSASSGGSGASGGGGSSSGSGGSGASGGSMDGGDMGLPSEMSLTAPARGGFSLFAVDVAYADEPGAQNASPDASAEALEETGLDAVVLADFTQTYLCLLNRGDALVVKVDDLFGFADRTLREGEELPVLSQESVDGLAEDASGAAGDAELSFGEPESDDLLISDEERYAAGNAEDLCTIVVNGQETTISEKLLRLDIEEDYVAWDGFAAEGAVLYSDYLLAAASSELEVNAPLHVVDAIGDLLVVEAAEGLFYIPASSVGTEEYVVEIPAEEAAAPPASSSSAGSSPSYRGHSSSGSSSSSGSGGGSSASSGSGSNASSGSGSSSSGGSSSGGSASGGSDSSGGGASGGESDWTPPVL